MFTKDWKARSVNSVGFLSMVALLPAHRCGTPLYRRTLLMTLYFLAVRRCELCRLKVSDIPGQRMMHGITQGQAAAIVLRVFVSLRHRVVWKSEKDIIRGTWEQWRVLIEKFAEIDPPVFARSTIRMVDSFVPYGLSSSQPLEGVHTVLPLVPVSFSHAKFKLRW
jgi:hypothetical protein